MRPVVSPRPTRLFDPFRGILSDVAYRRIERGWQGVFRHVILELMPVDALAGEFSPTMGTPTKELYSMAGLLLVKEFMDWTTTRAADAYMFDASVQYALNLEPSGQSLCERTIERYEKIFVENDLAAATMDRVTTTLVKALDLDVSRQRLDATRHRRHCADGRRRRPRRDARGPGQTRDERSSPRHAVRRHPLWQRRLSPGVRQARRGPSVAGRRKAERRRHSHIER